MSFLSRFSRSSRPVDGTGRDVHYNNHAGAGVRGVNHTGIGQHETDYNGVGHHESGLHGSGYHEPHPRGLGHHSTTHDGLGHHHGNNIHGTQPVVDSVDNVRDSGNYREKPLPRARGKRSLFGRRSSRSHNRDRNRNRPLFDKSSGQFNRRPSFGQWLKGTALDIFTMIVLGAIGLGVYFADPAPTRSFPIIFADGQIVYPQFAYPLRDEIIPIWAAALLGALVPIFFILVMQVRIRSFWDANNAILGLLYSLITAAVFQVFVKWLIGGLRPHFLDVCRPDLTRVAQAGTGDGYQQIMYTSDICTGDRSEINDSLESMPSGHSTAAFAGFMFLYFYLNAKLKVFSNHHPALWKLAVLYMPVLAATLIAGALTIDEFHNWYDCLAGAIIGTVFALSSYRMVYASVWDFRFNHIPLTRHTPFSYGAGAPGAAGFESAVFTRRAGWGYEEALGGAPFDAGHHLRGHFGGATSANTVDGDTIRGRHRPGDVEHNAGYVEPVGDHGAGVSTGNATTTRTTRTPENRYRHHRKSVERKAIPGPDSGLSPQPAAPYTTTTHT